MGDTAEGPRGGLPVDRPIITLGSPLFSLNHGRFLNHFPPHSGFFLLFRGPCTQADATKFRPLDSETLPQQESLGHDENRCRCSHPNCSSKQKVNLTTLAQNPGVLIGSIHVHAKTCLTIVKAVNDMVACQGKLPPMPKVVIAGTLDTPSSIVL